ncbi:MAG: hypothetical protein M3518_10355, partial [Actinomycetota bacterium]|nr:hypothetical protein [Actinomycetota bacterium]
PEVVQRLLIVGRADSQPENTVTGMGRFSLYLARRQIALAKDYGRLFIGSERTGEGVNPGK